MSARSDPRLPSRMRSLARDSQYGDIKLGKDDEKPLCVRARIALVSLARPPLTSLSAFPRAPDSFNDLQWFALVFTCGLGIGLFYYGVSEPIYYYRGYNKMQKVPWSNDDGRAQQAIFITLFHWGLHGWVPYVLFAINIGVVCHRGGYPIAPRYTLLPLLGEKVTNGFLGDLVDAVSIATTTYGVCTSLGMGVYGMCQGFELVGWADAGTCASINNQCWIVVFITAAATLSVLTGLKRGIMYLAMFGMFLATFFLLVVMFSDNTWYLLNVTVQSIGHYFQWIIQVGFDCEAFQQLGFEIDPDYNPEDTPRSSAGYFNMLIGSSNNNRATNFIQTMEDVQDAAPAWCQWVNDTNSYRGACADLPEDATSTTFLQTFEAASDPTTMYNESSAKFMDWWTIFYWGWWISWAPFVGLFLGKISRGRTIRNVILGAFFLPVAYSCVWFSVLGGLGIKVQRIAELALSGTVLNDDGTPLTFNPMIPSCAALGYSGGMPTTAEATAMADMGYYPLSCIAHTKRTYYAVAHFVGIKMLLWVSIVVGLFIWFVTSSDSGSYIDTLTSAQGHENTPPIQEIYWSWTEGLSAIALLKAGGRGGGSSLKALRAVSLIGGLPLTFLLCYMCSSTLQECKKVCGDADIVGATEWNTNSNDIWIGFDGMAGAQERLPKLLMACVCPFFQLKAVAGRVWGETPALVFAAFMTAGWYLWFLLVVIGHGFENNGSSGVIPLDKNDREEFYFGYNVGWALYICWCFGLMAIRSATREVYGIYGTYLEDLWQCIIQSPFIVAQLGAQAVDVPAARAVEVDEKAVEVEVNDESKSGGIEMAPPPKESEA